MVVLPHQHSLTLIDLNPNYPHNEEVYDDEEDLIIKQAIQCPCGLCDKKITYSYRYYYKCDQCEYSLHKLCAELPTKLERASHNAHTLTLILDKTLKQCHLCENVPEYKQLCYHCSQCMFNTCLECSMDDVQYHTIYHPGHQHPLVPASRQRLILTKCDACGKEHKGVFYECNKCFRFLIHNDCATQPIRLLIQEATRGSFVHPHQLILSYSFSKEYQMAKFYPTCRICDNSFANNKNFWIYKCEKCRYYVHIDCASSTNYEYSGRKITLEDYEDVLHLPFSDKTDQTYSKLRNFFFKESNKEKIITYNDHEHPLTLMDTACDDITTRMKTDEDLCNACVRSVIGMPFYMCTNGCSFVLHEWCTRLPVKLEGHEGHPKHPLSLFPEFPSQFNVFRCDVCDRLCNGFVYSCLECNYNVDVTCAFKRIAHKSHPHHFLSIVKEREDKDYCRMCLSSFTNNEETSFTCEACNFHLHLRCALLLPETIRSKYDKHPMTLRYIPIENHEGDYFCEECEGELNPNACFYHCDECIQSMHPACAILLSPSIPPSQAFIFNGFSMKHPSFYSNMKFGAMYTMQNYHPHPLSLSPAAGDDNRCYYCRHIPTHESSKIVLKCLQCGFLIHKECVLLAMWFSNI